MFHQSNKQTNKQKEKLIERQKHLLGDISMKEVCVKFDKNS